MIDIVKRRRSVREYLNVPISEKDVYEMLESGLYAPSGKNRQPWRFLIVKEKDKIKQISKFTTYSRFIQNAPILILVYAYSSGDYLVEKDIFSIGACVQNILLVATQKGYGTCVIGELLNKDLEVDTVLNSNLSGNRLICAISIGKTSKKNIRKKILNLEEFLLILDK